MSQTLAALGIVTDSAGVVKTTSDLREMARAARDSQTSVSMFTTAMQTVTPAASGAAGATKKMNEEVQKTRGLLQSTKTIIDSTDASTRKYVAALNDVKRAYREGSISLGDYARSTQIINAQMRAAAASSGNFAGMTNRTTYSITNASYQLQDFAVQIASGTDAMRAFAQQAPQFLGALGFSGKLALMGSLAGTLVAAGAAFLPMMFRTNEEAKKGKTAFEEASEAMAKYSSYMDQARENSDKFATSLDSQNKKLRDIALSQAQFQKDEALRLNKEGIQSQANTALRGVGRNTVSYDGGYLTSTLDAQATAEEAARRLDTHIVGALGIIEQLRNAANATTMDELANTAQEATSLFTNLYGEISKAPKELQPVWRSLADIALEYGETTSYTAAELDRMANDTRLNERYTQLVETANRQLEVTISSNKAEDARNKAASETLVTLQSQADMINAIREYGAESAQVEQLKYEAAMRSVDAFIQQNHLTGQTAQDLRDAAQAAFEAQSATDSWAASMASVKAQVAGIAGLLSSMGAKGIDMVRVNTTREALARGESVAKSTLSGQRAAEDARSAQRASGIRQDIAQNSSGALTDMFASMSADIWIVADQHQTDTLREATDLLTEDLAVASAAEREASKAARGGGKGKKAKKSESQKAAEKEHKDNLRDASRWLDKIRDTTQQIQVEQAELNSLYQEGYFGEVGSVKALSTYSQAMKMVMEEYDPLTKATKEWTSTLKDGILDSIIGANSLSDSLLNVAKAIERAMWQATLFGEGPLAKMWSGVFGGGLMSGAGSWLGGLFGSAMGGGDALTASLQTAGLGAVSPFAKGGAVQSTDLSKYSSTVVDSPTFFAFAKGAGVAGEAGPEGILPLSRGPDGKLGVTSRTGESPEKRSSDELGLNISFDKGDLWLTITNAVGRVLRRERQSIIKESVAASGAAARDDKRYMGMK